MYHWYCQFTYFASLYNTIYEWDNLVFLLWLHLTEYSPVPLQLQHAVRFHLLFICKNSLGVMLGHILYLFCSSALKDCSWWTLGYIHIECLDQAPAAACKTPCFLQPYVTSLSCILFRCVYHNFLMLFPLQPMAYFCQCAQVSLPTVFRGQQCSGSAWVWTRVSHMKGVYINPWTIFPAL